MRYEYFAKVPGWVEIWMFNLRDSCEKRGEIFHMPNLVKRLDFLTQPCTGLSVVNTI